MPSYPSTGADIFELKAAKNRPNGYAGLDALGRISGVLSNGVAGPPGPAGATGATGPAGASGTPVQSVTAPATATGGTITAGTLTVSRVAPIANITGVILAVGTIPGQPLSVLNESAFTITFAVAATSNVSIGVNCVITAQVFLQFAWDSVTNLWYPAAVGSTSTPPPTGTFGTGTFGSGTFGGGALGIAGVYDTAVYDTDTYS